MAVVFRGCVPVRAHYKWVKGLACETTLAPWTCARPRAELSEGHDSIIRELKFTASKSLVVSLSESAGQNYKHIAIQKLQTLPLESLSPINTLLSIDQNICGCASHEMLYWAHCYSGARGRAQVRDFSFPAHK